MPRAPRRAATLRTTARRRLILSALIVFACTDEAPADAEPVNGSSESGTPEPRVCDESEVSTAYERRIAPLLADDRPSTCNECHLTGIDLGMYVQNDACQTMACLVDQGLVDLDNPDNSLLLSWVARAEPTGLISRATIDEEYAGVSQWIREVAECGQDVCPQYEQPCGGPPEIDECALTLPEGPGEYDDLGGCSDLAIESLWYETVYQWRGRCYPCHFEGFELDNEEFAGPRWVVPGECDEGSLLSLRRVEAGGYIDVEEPSNSLLLLKPLEEELGGVEHGGDAKIHSKAEGVYIDMMRFAERYSECYGGE